MRRAVGKFLRVLPVAATLMLAGAILLTISAVSKPRSHGQGSRASTFEQFLCKQGRQILRFPFDAALLISAFAGGRCSPSRCPGS